MMCANFANLEKDTKDLEVAGVDIFHVGPEGNTVKSRKLFTEHSALHTGMKADASELFAKQLPVAFAHQLTDF